jgi:hypothetical protein
MKKLLYLVAFLALCGLAKASSVDCEIEICKNNVWSAQEGEYLKQLVPKYSDWFNSYIVALKQGMTASYDAWIWLDQEDDPIRSAYVVKPNAERVTLKKDGPGEFTDETGNGPSEFYTSIADLKSHWPSGDYVLHVTFADGHTQTWTTTVPDYNTTPFPDIVSGSLSSGTGGLLSLDWSTVDEVSEYEVSANEIKKGKDVYESGNLYPTPPQSLTTVLTGVYEGKGDYGISVEAEQDVTSGDFRIEFDSQAEWFSFKKPVAPIENTISITMKPGKTGKSKDNISFTGLLNAIAADLIIADSNGNNIVVDINAVNMSSPLEFQFPLNSTTFKKGVYSGTGPGKNSSFKFDTKTGKMTFSAKNLDLTGLVPPPTVTITIGDYEADFTVD